MHPLLLLLPCEPSSFLIPEEQPTDRDPTRDFITRPTTQVPLNPLGMRMFDEGERFDLRSPYSGGCLYGMAQTSRLIGGAVPSQTLRRSAHLRTIPSTVYSPSNPIQSPSNASPTPSNLIQSDMGWVDPDETDAFAGIKNIGKKLLNFGGWKREVRGWLGVAVAWSELCALSAVRHPQPPPNNAAQSALNRPQTSSPNQPTSTRIPPGARGPQAHHLGQPVGEGAGGQEGAGQEEVETLPPLV